MIKTSEDVYTFVWTGRNITTITKDLKKLAEEFNFVDNNLYISRLGGYIQPNSTIVVIPGVGAIGAELNK